MFSPRDKRLRIYSAETLPAVYHVKNLLAAERIETEIRNENLGSVMGEIPFFDVWPELWLLNMDDLAAATQHVNDYLRAPPITGPDWRCANCANDNEAQFAICWQCGHAADDDSV